MNTKQEILLALTSASAIAVRTQDLTKVREILGILDALEASVRKQEAAQRRLLQKIGE